jgi:ABC-2 type transport system permease protein
LLSKHGVTRIEDLPVNFKGAVSLEGERQSSELFNRYAAAAFDRQRQQNALVDGFSWLAPTLALRRLSMAASGTDLLSFQRFIEQGEQDRYDLVQGLNRLHAEALSYADETNPARSKRISHAHWQKFPAFEYRAEPLALTLGRAAPAALVLLLWLAALAGLAWRAGRRLERNLR